MRRPLAVLAALLLGSGLAVAVAAPAHAADRTVRMQYTFPDASTQFDAVACTEGAQPDPGSGRFDLSDVGPSMRVSGFPTGTAGGFTHTGRSLAGEPVLQYSRYAPTDALTRVVFEFSEAGSATTWRGEFLTLPGPGWQVGDPMAATYYWVERTSGAATGRTTYGTPDGLRQSQKLADGSFRVSVGFGCEGETVYVDQIRYGAEGDLTRLDVERYRTEVPASAAQSVMAGRPATLSTVIGARDDVSGEQARLRGGRLTLQRADGEGWADVTTAAGDSGSDDHSAIVAPSTTTTYRWSFAGDAAFEPAVSAPFTVTVTPRMTPPKAPTLAAAAVKAKVKQGRRVVIEGQLAPATPGAVVTLWQRKATGDKALATGVVALDGRFRLDATARRKGRLQLYVAGAGATSDLVTVKVKPRRR